MSNSGYIHNFQTYLKYEKEASENSAKAYIADLRLFLSYSGCNEDSFNPALVTRNDIRSWIMGMYERGISSRTINRRLTSLRVYFRWALSEELIDSDPTAAVSKMKETRYLPNFINEEDMAKILSKAKENTRGNELSAEDEYHAVLEYTVLLTLYSTGMRRSELLNINLRDIDFSLSQIRTVGKGGKQRIIPLVLQLKESIEQYIAVRNKYLDCAIDENFLFLWSDGKRLSYHHLLKIVKDAMRREGIQGKLSPHVFRHTFATHLLKEGAEITAIKELLGHSSLLTTQVYTHNTIEELKSVYSKAHPRAKQKD